MKETKRKNDGFTLVELIVVLVLVSVLSAVMVPSFLAYIDDVRAQQDLIKAKELMIKAQDFFDELFNSDNEDDKTPNIDNQGNVSPNKNLNWMGKKGTGYPENTQFSFRFKEMAGLWTDKTGSATEAALGIKHAFGEDCPYLLCLIVGDSSYNNSLDPRVKRKAFTIYGIVYQREPESKTVCFDGNQWVTDMKGTWPYDVCDKWGNTKKSGFIYINNMEISVQAYWVNRFVPYTDPGSAIKKIKDQGYCD